MRFGAGKDRTTIIYNTHLTLNGIPERAFDYEVNGRPAIEWIMDRYQVRTDSDSGIHERPQRLLRRPALHRRPVATRGYGESRDAGSS